MKHTISTLLIAFYSLTVSAQSNDDNVYYEALNPFMVGTQAFDAGTIISLMLDPDRIAFNDQVYPSDIKLINLQSMSFYFYADWIGYGEFLINYDTKKAMLRMRYATSEYAMINLREISSSEIKRKRKEAENERIKAAEEERARIAEQVKKRNIFFEEALALEKEHQYDAAYMKALEVERLDGSVIVWEVNSLKARLQKSLISLNQGEIELNSFERKKVLNAFKESWNNQFYGHERIDTLLTNGNQLTISIESSGIFNVYNGDKVILRKNGLFIPSKVLYDFEVPCTASITVTWDSVTSKNKDYPNENIIVSEKKLIKFLKRRGAVPLAYYSGKTRGTKYERIYLDYEEYGSNIYGVDIIVNILGSSELKKDDVCLLQGNYTIERNYFIKDSDFEMSLGRVTTGEEQYSETKNLYLSSSLQSLKEKKKIADKIANLEIDWKSIMQTAGAIVYLGGVAAVVVYVWSIQ